MGKQPITIPKEELERQREFSEQIRRHYLETLGRQPLACVDTYGCQQNEADSRISPTWLFSIPAPCGSTRSSGFLATSAR